MNTSQARRTYQQIWYAFNVAIGLWGAGTNTIVANAFFRRKVRALVLRYAWQYASKPWDIYLPQCTQMLENVRGLKELHNELYDLDEGNSFSAYNGRSYAGTEALIHAFAMRVNRTRASFIYHLTEMIMPQYPPHYVEEPFEQVRDAVTDVVGQHYLNMCDLHWADNFISQNKHYSDAHALARQAYNTLLTGVRADEEIAVFADALTDVNAPDVFVNHLRRPTGCGLGCWVLDLFLGKHKGLTCAGVPLINLTYERDMLSGD